MARKSKSSRRHAGNYRQPRRPTILPASKAPPTRKALRRNHAPQESGLAALMGTPKLQSIYQGTH